MLVLSRKVGERILIGDQVAITVVRINATTVRLGIDAPSKLVVVREELAAAERDSSERDLSEQRAPSTAR
jgi:carbon storage regulator